MVTVASCRVPCNDCDKDPTSPMATRITRHSASAEIEMQADGLTLVTMRGPITYEALMHFKTEAMALHGPHVRGQVVDYTDAAVAFDSQALTAVVSREPAGAPQVKPVVFLVRPECIDLFSGHTTRLAVRGVLRHVVTRQAVAFPWLQWMLGQELESD